MTAALMFATGKMRDNDVAYVALSRTKPGQWLRRLNAVI